MIQSQEIPFISSRRVDSIRTRLDDDNYTVDIKQITRKFIDMEIALTGRGKTHSA